MRCQTQPMSDARLSCAMISPALANANNGNWYTASRWQEFLEAEADVSIALAWDGVPVDVMIALHARRSADSIAGFASAYPERPLIVVLTGTDIYRDIKTSISALHSLHAATHLVVLQEEALLELEPHLRSKARVIVQSAPRLPRLRPGKTSFDFVAVGHLRDEKDPLTLLRTVQEIPESSRIRLIHIGDALEDTLGQAARQTMRLCPHYRWLGGLPQTRVRRWIARSQALIHSSVMEGGANVIIEAIQSGVPVLASFISGNIGMLGRDYAGYFPVGDAQALARLMLRFTSDPAFSALLTTQCAARAMQFEPAHEQQLVRQLFNEVRFKHSNYVE